MECFVARPPIFNARQEVVSYELALLGQKGRFQRSYRLVLACEDGNWAEFARLAAILRLEEPRAAQLFRQSVEWTDQVLQVEASGGAQRQSA